MNVTAKIPATFYVENTTLQADLEIKKCLQAFNYFYAQKSYPQAFEQVWLALNLFEESDNSRLKIELLKCAVICAPYFIVTKDSKPFLESIVAHESVNNAPEILSLCYFLLSVNSLQSNASKYAVDYGIMAYYYARKCKDESHFYECNAQLQLVTSLIEECTLQRAQQYIERFQWQMDQCRNPQELIFVQSIEATLQLLQGNKEVALAQMNAILLKFIHSEEVMYTSYLALHFKRFLLKHGDFKENALLIGLCNKVVNRVSVSYATFNEITHSHFTLHTQIFYLRSNELVAQHLKKIKKTTLHKFTLCNDAFTISLLIEQLSVKNIQFYIHEYAPNFYTFISCSLGHQLLLELYEQKKLQCLASFYDFILTKHQFYQVFYNEINRLALTEADAMTIKDNR